MKSKYTKKEYLKYVEEGKKIGYGTLAFNDWKRYQPICDAAVGIVNKIIIKKQRSKLIKN